MQTSLRSQLNDLASSFAEQIVAAIRGGSLNDLLVPSGGLRKVARECAKEPNRVPN